MSPWDSETLTSEASPQTDKDKRILPRNQTASVGTATKENNEFIFVGVLFSWEKT
jgi:hypothetical protein